MLTNVSPVSKKSYTDIFNTQFNYGFGTPRSDTCATWDLGTNVERHKLRASEAFAEQNIVKELASKDKSVVYITFDLQKTLPLPKLSTVMAFYLRQLRVYNFGIHMTSVGKSMAYFSIWFENQTGRGCEEVGSSLLAFVEDTLVGRSENPRHLICWSDS